MRIDGVRGALHLVMVERKPLRSPCRGDLRLERLGVLPRPELGRAVGAPVHSGLGHLGVELERTPSDGCRDVRRERRDRAIQSPLGDPAPGADSIGNYVNR
jgi:hypothetical protein